MPLSSTRPAPLPAVLALTAAASTEAVDPVLPVGEAESLADRLGEPEPEEEEEDEEVIRAGPLADELDALALALMLELPLALALALGEGLAARLALPPPIDETGVHCEVAPAGWGAGVVGSPCRKVEPPYTPGASSVGSPSQLSNPGSCSG